MGVSVDNLRGLSLALSSSVFIGSSYIVKKKGLKKAATTGVRAGSGGFSYLYEPLWWIGMATMIVGEAANFAAYAFAPAILVTPLGALSIIVSAVLAHFMLNEKLHIFGILGCILCVVGSTTIVLHAPKEREIESVKEVWHLATEPGFLVYTCLVVALVAFLIIRLVPRYGQTHLIVYVGICSLMGSLTVMCVKTVSIALKLTIMGMNQFVYYQTWIFTAVVIACIVTQLNYLNKALDTFNTAVISPVHYVMFSTFTILASMIMFQDWDSQNGTQIATELCGFITIVSGTFLLLKTMDQIHRITHNTEQKKKTKTKNHCIHDFDFLKLFSEFTSQCADEFQWNCSILQGLDCFNYTIFTSFNCRKSVLLRATMRRYRHLAIIFFFLSQFVFYLGTVTLFSFLLVHSCLYI